MSEIFGRSISREFYALSDDAYINLPSQAPALYLYSALPGLSAARAGTGAIASAAYWSETQSTPFKRSYTWSAISDPDPTSSTTSRGYWEVINYISVTGGQQITEIRPITIERADTHDSVVNTDSELMRSLWTPISTYYPSDAQLELFISLAVDHFKLDLAKRDLEWGKVQGLKAIRIPIAYKALFIAMRGQVGRNAALADIVNEFESEYQAYSAAIKLPYDEANDGNVVTVTPVSHSVRIER